MNKFQRRESVAVRRTSGLQVNVDKIAHNKKFFKDVEDHIQNVKSSSTAFE